MTRLLDPIRSGTQGTAHHEVIRRFAEDIGRPGEVSREQPTGPGFASDGADDKIDGNTIHGKVIGRHPIGRIKHVPPPQLKTQGNPPGSELKPVPRRYAGLWVAWTPDGREIVGAGPSLEEAGDEAKRAGHDLVMYELVPPAERIFGL